MRIKRRILFAGLFLLATNLIHAEVIDAGDSGFHIKIDIELAASKERAYAQFMQVGEWWDPDHSWFGEASGFYIEPKAGGCFCEKSDDKSVLHMLVSFVDPGNQIKMLGGLGPLQDMGLHGSMSFTFSSVSENKSRLVHEYRVTGYRKGGLQELASVVDAVQQSQVERLRAKLVKK